MNKKTLAIILSKLKPLEEYNCRLEQYTTESEEAAAILWNALLNGHIQDKLIADFGCGNGILGIGALLCDAKKVIFIDIDEKAIEKTKENIKIINENFQIKQYEFLNTNIQTLKITKKIDTIIQNPPFGTKKKGIDVEFLKKAFTTTNIIYSIHKTSTKKYIEKLAQENKFNIKSYDFKFKIKNIMKHHKKPQKNIETTLFLFEKQKTI